MVKFSRHKTQVCSVLIRSSILGGIRPVSRGIFHAAAGLHKLRYRRSIITSPPAVSLAVLTRASAKPLAFLHTAPRLLDRRSIPRPTSITRTKVTPLASLRPAPRLPARRLIARPTSILWTGLACALSCSAMPGGTSANVRPDGVLMGYDPYAPGMAAKYGAPGNTDSEGFDPYRDTVGAGIYSGTVQRDEYGAVVIGKQYQNHNSRPGPVYSGGGYTPTSTSLGKFRAERSGEKTSEGGGIPGGETSLGKLLKSYPDLVNEVRSSVCEDDP